MSHPVDVHVGQKIKQMRRLRRMSQTDVAGELGLSFQQIQKYEIGANRVSASRLYELSKVFGVPTSVFFEGFDDGESEDSDSNLAMKIVSAVAAIDDEQLKSRIVTFIEDAAGITVAVRRAS